MGKGMSMIISTDNKQLQKVLESFLWELKQDLERDLDVFTDNSGTRVLLSEVRRVIRTNFGKETATELLREKE